ncbi:CbiM family transporter [Natranaerobius thermophilus]|uniref:Cobalamin (Vitamin B12) biosynthesis CbiM protein n=1 Tax=Natranaerobius thermophilus (strain ATCC BAA-1301 / DSM 18059 / JW/NM-WN-LF) TaxID=457570 RepID=B2A199_NATTJ|nr:CbiM family transporter [Natranaerobius thermophilus]ACB86037.1 cobalamin (vitamin B12) biosynthesis CbiM protein [Natranaerobius thermophilus JW/NM-WN-LF]
MHIADGVLSLPVVVSTFGATAAAVGYSVKGIEEEEVPKISLMAGGFFAVSLISIPVGPSTIHPLFAGLLGVILGKRAPLAIFVGLLLQAVLFQHGGLTTLGANTFMLAVPALLSYKIYYGIVNRGALFKGALVGGLAVVITVIILILLLLLANFQFTEGTFSTINILVVGHLPLIFIEALVTGSALKLVEHSNPELLNIAR